MKSLVREARGKILNHPGRCFPHVFKISSFGTTRCTLHEIWRYSDQASTYAATKLENPTMFDRLHQDPPVNPAGQLPVARFQMVEVLKASSSDILKLYDACGFPEDALRVIAMQRYLFQCFDSSTSSATSCFGLSLALRKMVWQYSWDQCSTIALAFTSTDEIACEQHKDDLIHPLALGALSLQKNFPIIEAEYTRICCMLEKAEARTGHTLSLSSGNTATSQLASWELEELSREISHLQCRAHNAQFWLKTVQTINRELIALSLDELYNETRSQAAATWPKGMRATLQWHKVLLDSSQRDINLLLSEVRVQNSVIFNLITQQDARQSIRLAESSTALAEAAKKDTLSMQTIALMTMAILPATLFAALFAMPLLRWDRSPVIQDQFWVYLAFTLPSTAMVFGIWGGVPFVRKEMAGRKKLKTTVSKSSDM